MPSKEELLRALTVKKLRELAKENKVSLVQKDWLFGDSRATTKEEIIEIFMESRKISKKKIEAKLSAPSRKRTSTRTKAVTRAKPKRRGLAKAEKTKIMKRQKHKCARCGMDISKLTVVHYDHKRPLALGGSDTLRNLQALCPNCHAEKTQEDRLKISRARQ